MSEFISGQEMIEVIEEIASDAGTHEAASSFMESAGKLVIESRRQRDMALEVCMKLAKYGRAMCKQHMSSEEAEKAGWGLADAILDAEEAIAKATGNATQPLRPRS